MAAYAALLSLMHIIHTLENHNRPPISLNKNHVHLLTEKITFLQEFLEAYNPNLGYTAEADPLETRIADAAYAAEDVIESHIVDHITNQPLPQTMAGKLQQFIKDVKKIGKRWGKDEEKKRRGKELEKMTDEVFYEAVEKVIEEMALIEKEAMQLQPHLLHTKSTPPYSSRSSSIAQVQHSRMVGADELLLEMKDKLTSDRLALQVISIVGMGGSGKTTLAINIYQERLIMEHFHIRAWATFSQEYSIREILQELLNQLIKKQDRQDLSEGELEDMLHKHLYGRRYLIVLDDIWSIEAWDGIRMCLPNNTNGSRIVVTTRLSILASNLSNSSSLKMNLLDEDNSWKLLSRIVFGEKDCPIEFEKIGKEIGKSCKGLPLSIVVVGGLLTKSNHTIEFWEYISENLNSAVNLEDDERYFKILYMSYKQLPVHLKPCFLYMGVFQEDEEIRTTRLVKLWVAEGFLKPISNKCMEEVALEYLEELIGRNLILVHKLGSIGKIKECKIHDLLRDLCVREAEKERFYTMVGSPPQGIVKNAAQRRIVVSRGTSKDEAINAMSSMPLARTLIWNLKGNELPPLHLRLLRIFESYELSFTSKTCLESVRQLVNSRYINISPFECSHSMVRFWNLQTLCCRYLKYSGTTLTFLLDMIQIRHIQCHNMELDYDQLQGDNIVLGNLQTLGWLWNFKCSKEIIKRIPNIKKLKTRHGSSFDEKYCLNNLICLDKLESFTWNLEFLYRCDSLQRLISFPDSLIKLDIHLNSNLFWESILDEIGSLPHLQKLRLGWGSFKEGQWETTEGQFRSLKVLVIRCCWGLHVWTTECSHFPCLERLSLYDVHKLEEIPLDFAEILTLKAVEVIRCSDSAVESAKRIVEEQVELYGEEEAALQVHVTLSRHQNENAALKSLASPNFHVR